MGALFSLTPDGFLRADGQLSRFIRIGGAEGPSTEWEQRQNAAVPGYEHELDAVPADLQRLYDIFGWYVARAMIHSDSRRILDVGCGIGSRLPPYIRPLGATLATRRMVYVGLDPVELNVEDRDYPFVCGRIEDLPAVLEDRFDLFLFSTSLDHMEDTARAAAAVRGLAAENALAVFWMGLHDPSLVAEELGRKWFGRLGASLNPPRYLWQAALIVAIMLRRYPDLLWRARKLEQGGVLDDLHFHYFTRDNVTHHLERFGVLRDFIHIPGTNSAFATVAVRGQAGG